MWPKLDASEAVAFYRNVPKVRLREGNLTVTVVTYIGASLHSITQSRQKSESAAQLGRYSERCIGYSCRGTAVASVETVRGGGTKVKLWNKNNALDSLGRWRRMFVELQERGKPGEFDHQTNEELRADIEMLQAITKAKRSAKESSDS